MSVGSVIDPAELHEGRDGRTQLYKLVNWLRRRALTCANVTCDGIATGTRQLASLNSISFDQGQTAFVISVGDPWLLEESARTVDNITIVDALNKPGYQWIRQLGVSGYYWGEDAWEVDATSGDDENTGAVGDPIRTWAELSRRLLNRRLPIGVLNSIAVTFSGNTADTDPISIEMKPIARNGAITVSIIGTPTTTLLGTLTAVTPHSYATNQADTITIAAFDWSPYVGKVVRRVGTSGATGQTSIVEEAVSLGVARVTPVNVGAGPGTAWAIGDAVEVLTMPKAQGARAAFTGLLAVYNVDFAPSTVPVFVDISGDANVRLTGCSLLGSANGSFITNGGGRGILCTGTVFSTRRFSTGGNLSADRCALMNAVVSISNSDVGRNEWQDTTLNGTSSLFLNDGVYCRFHSLGIYSQPAAGIGVDMFTGAFATFTDAIYGTGNNATSRAFFFRGKNSVELGSAISSLVADVGIVATTSSPTNILLADLPYYPDTYENEIVGQQSADPPKHLAVGGRDLSATSYPYTDVVGLLETGGPTHLLYGSIPDGNVLIRSGLNVIGGGPVAGFAPADATYITQTPNATLTNEQALSLLGTGVMSSTTATGVVATTTFTTGSVAFGKSSILGQDNAGLFYDDNDRVLVIGTNLWTAGQKLKIIGTRSLASAAGLTWDPLFVDPGTLTLTGNTQVTTARGLDGVYVAAPTITDGSAVTVDQAATVVIGGAPTAGGSVTITNRYALWSIAGAVRHGDLAGAGTAFVTADANGVLARGAATSSVAPVDATYITQIPNGTLTNEQALSLLSSGVMHSVTATGVVSTFAVGATRVPFGSGSNGAITDSANMTYASDVLTLANGARLDISANQNSAFLGFHVLNSNAGAGAQVQNRLENNAGSFAYYGIASSAFAGFAPLDSGKAFIGSNGADFSIFTQGATAINLYTTATRRISIASGGGVTVDPLAGGGTAFVTADASGLLARGVSTGSFAPVDATYITQIPNATLTNEQALSLLGTGVMSSTTATGVVATTTFTAGSVPYGKNSILTQDNAGFFFDETNRVLAIGTNSITAGQKLKIAGNVTLASATSLTWDPVHIAPGTLSLTGNTQVTTARGLDAVYVAAPTITDGSAITVDAAATVVIDGPPAAGGSVTITTPYALWVRDGLVAVADRLQATPGGTIAWMNVGVGAAGNNEQVRGHWVANVWRLEMERGGTGANRDMVISADTMTLTATGALVQLTGNPNGVMADDHLLVNGAVAATNTSFTTGLITNNDRDHVHFYVGGGGDQDGASNALFHVIPSNTDITTAQNSGILSTVRINSLTYNGTGSPTPSAAASLYIQNQPTLSGATGDSYALFVDAGLARFDSDGTHVFELPGDATIDGNAIGRIPIKVSGSTMYLHYYDG